MPRNSQGVYTLPAGNPVQPSTLITSTWANPTMSDLGNEITGSLPRSGSAPMTGPLILFGEATNNLEAVSLGQVGVIFDQKFDQEYKPQFDAYVEACATSEANAASSALDSANCRQESYDQAVISTTKAGESADSAAAALVSENNATTQADRAEDEADRAEDEADRAEGYANSTGNKPLVSSSVLANWLDALNLYTVETLGTTTVTYTGNGSSQDIVTDIDSVDFTVAFNGSGYWLDRTTNEIKSDAGVVQESGSCTWGNGRGVSYTRIKARSVLKDNIVTDGLRGLKNIYTNETTAEQDAPTKITSFNPDGFSLGNSTGVNQSGATFVAYQELYTHIKWGKTNQDKFYVEAYNPITKQGMIYYIGSGVAGHSIPHSQAVKLSYNEIKNLDAVTNWSVWFNGIGDGALNLDTTSAIFQPASGYVADTDASNIQLDTDGARVNSLDQEYITYYKANSDVWKIIEYTGTGAAGNYIPVGFKVSEVIIKRTDSADWWSLYDNQRNDFDAYLLLNASNSEAIADYLDVTSSDGVTINSTVGSINGNGYKYILLAKADTKANGGGSYYDQPTDGVLNVNSGIFNYSGKITDKGYESSSRIVTKSISAIGVSDGFKWVSENEDGTVSWYDEKPSPTYNELGVSWKDGAWYDDGVLMNPKPSFIPRGIRVDNGKVQYLDDDLLEINVQPYTAFPDGLTIHDTMFLSGLPTVDPFLNGAAWNNNGILTISGGA